MEDLSVLSARSNYLSYDGERRKKKKISRHEEKNEIKEELAVSFLFAEQNSGALNIERIMIRKRRQ